MLEAFGTLTAAIIVLGYALGEHGPGFTVAFATRCAALRGGVGVRLRYRLVALLCLGGDGGGRGHPARALRTRGPTRTHHDGEEDEECDE